MNRRQNPGVIAGHTPECAVNRQRIELLDEVRIVHKWMRGDGAPEDAEKRFGTKVATHAMDYLMGAVMEYYNGGDQEVEGCDCGGRYDERFPDINADRVRYGRVRGVVSTAEIYGRDLEGKKVWMMIHNLEKADKGHFEYEDE